MAYPMAGGLVLPARAAPVPHQDAPELLFSGGGRAGGRGAATLPAERGGHAHRDAGRCSNLNQIVFTIFRLIWNQTDVLYQSGRRWFI